MRAAWVFYVALLFSVRPEVRALAQVYIPPERLIHLPVRTSRGGYTPTDPLGLLLNEPAREHFSLEAAPNGDLLTFDSDSNGKWPLVRTRRWWTDAPTEEVLLLPGWTAAEGRYLDKLLVLVAISPSGRYAVATGEAHWYGTSDFLLHVPHGYVTRESEVIVTIVDLEQWRVVESFHRSASMQPRAEEVRALRDGLSAPDGQTQPEKVADPEPTSLKLRDTAWRDALPGRDSGALRGEAERLHDWQAQNDEYKAAPGEYPYNVLYAATPPLESSAHRWYGLYEESNSRPFYELVRYDVHGNREDGKVARQFLCEDPAMGHPKSWCSNRVIEVSESQKVVMALCRQQRGDYLGTVLHEWLGLFRSDALTPLGAIELDRRQHIWQRIVVGDGKPYVLTLEHGEVLRVYPIPR